MRKVSLLLSEELGREPTNDDLALEMGITASKIAHLKSVSVRPTSLDAPVGDGDNTEFGDLVGDENAPNPFDYLRSKTLMDDIKAMVAQLTPREGEIIRLRFGLWDGDKPRTLEEVGYIFNITRERVRQLQNLALSRMRKILAKKERQRSADETREEQLQQERMKVLQEFYRSKMEN